MSALKPLPADFLRALAGMREARKEASPTDLPFQIWRAGGALAIAVAYRVGRGDRLTARTEGTTIRWRGADGIEESIRNVPDDAVRELSAGLLVIYVDAASEEPLGEATLVVDGEVAQ